MKIEIDDIVSLLHRRANLVEPWTADETDAKIDYAIARTLRDLATDLLELQAKEEDD